MMDRKCNKCGKVFSSTGNLNKHKRKKVPCNRVDKCPTCERIFNTPARLKRHRDRKIPCTPPQVKNTENVCEHCNKTLSTAWNLKNHLKKCKVKRGGVSHLLKIIEEKDKKAAEQMERLQRQVNMLVMERNISVANNNGTINNNCINNNHYNTTLNINLVNYKENSTMLKMMEVATEYIKGMDLTAEPTPENIAKQIVQLVVKIHRNPEHKELQNIYVQDIHNKGDAFIYNNDKWNESSWEVVSALVMSQLHTYTMNTYMHNKSELLAEIANVLCAYNKHSSSKISDYHRNILHKIAMKLTFDSIINKNQHAPLLLAD